MNPIISKTLLFTLIVMNAIPLLSTNMFLASIDDIASEFGTSYGSITFALSAYLIFTAFVQLIVGPIADQFGRRPTILISVALFIIASAGTALATSYITFLIFRIIQGAIATGLALSRAVVSDIIPTKEAASTLGYIGMVMSLAPIIGPSIGGGLSELAGWRSNFWLYTFLGIGLWLLVWGQLPETGIKKSSTTKDFFYSYLDLISIADFWRYALIMSLGIGAFFCFITGIPIVAAQQFDMDQGSIGLCIGSITCGFLFGSFVSGRFGSKYSLDVMILSGRYLACLGLLISIFFISIGFVPLKSLLGGILLVGVGNGLTSPSANLAVISVRKDLSASASGLAGALIVLTGAIMTGITGAILDVYPNTVALISVMSFVTAISFLIAAWQIYFKNCHSG